MSTRRTSTLPPTATAVLSQATLVFLALFALVGLALWIGGPPRPEFGPRTSAPDGAPRDVAPVRPVGTSDGSGLDARPADAPELARRAVTHPSAPSRAAALTALADHDEPTELVLSTCLAALVDEDARVRAAAGSALTDLDDRPRVLSALALQLTQPDRQRRVAAATVMDALVDARLPWDAIDRGPVTLDPRRLH